MRKYFCCKNCLKKFEKPLVFPNDFEYSEDIYAFNCEICKKHDYPQNFDIIELSDTDFKNATAKKKNK